MLAQLRKVCGLVFLMSCSFVELSAKGGAKKFLEQNYLEESKKSFLFNEVSDFMPRLKELAKECSTVVELGGDQRAGSVSIVLGLMENFREEKKFYLYCPRGFQRQDKKFLRKFSLMPIEFVCDNREFLFQTPFEVDLVYVNSWHTYPRLYSELCHFAPFTKKFIAILHTHSHWENEDEPDYSLLRYSPFKELCKDKKGLRLAIEDFLNSHTEWEKFEDHANSHGFTILKRVK